jgi:hypothetical protein
MNAHDRTPKNKTILDQALYLASRGWAVFPAPAGSKKSHASKNTNGANWGATSDPDQIRRYWQRWPDANLGFPTGVHADFFVVEADTVKGHGVDGIENLKRLETQNGKIPTTVEAVSPSGSRHFYFLYPRGVRVKNSENKIAAGIDVRGDGGMVIAPPSLRGNGVYSWINSPEDTKFVECPNWLLTMILNTQTPKKTERPHTPTPFKPAQNDEVQELLSYIDPDAGGYEDWRNVLFALHDHYNGSEEGKAVADAWSAQGGKYVAGEVAYMWDRFKAGGGVKWETIPAMAARNGADLSAIAIKYKVEAMQERSQGVVVDLSQFRMPSGKLVLERLVSEFFVATEFAEEERPPREWLVENFIPMFTVSSLYGDGGTGKSLAALQLAVSVSLGRSWFGQDARSGRVLFISAEDDRDDPRTARQENDQFRRQYGDTMANGGAGAEVITLRNILDD